MQPSYGPVWKRGSGLLSWRETRAKGLRDTRARTAPEAMGNGRPKSANEKKRDERLSLFLFLSPPKRRREQEETTRGIAGISLFFVRAQLKKNKNY